MRIICFKLGQLHSDLGNSVIFKRTGNQKCFEKKTFTSTKICTLVQTSRMISENISHSK